jgi:hypothetical protein
VNDGISWDSPGNVYWKHDVERSESLKIILHGNAEFEAKDVLLKVFIKKQCEVYFHPFYFSYYLISLFYQGNHIFEVPDGHRMCIIQDGSGLLVACTLLSGSKTTCVKHSLFP